MRKWSQILAPVCLAALALFGWGCQPDAQAPREPAAKLSVISPHTTDIRDNLMPLFKQWYRRQTGREVEVEWINQGGSSDNLRFLRAEYARTPQSVNIDLFWGGGISPHFTLKQEGLLEKQEVDPKILNPIPRELSGIPLYDPDRQWFGSCLSSFGIMANQLVCQSLNFPPIRTWEDLTDPRLRGWITAADPRHSGVGHVAFDIILQAYGWEKGWRILTLLSANVKNFKVSSKDLSKDLLSGDAAYTLTVDYYAWREIEQLGADKVAFIIPEGLSMVNPDCVSVLKGAPHREEARRFIEYILSEEGQRVWMLKSGLPGGPPVNSLFRLSLLPSVYDQVQGKTVIDINPFQSKSFISYDITHSEQLWDVLNDLMCALLIDTHDDLDKAWQHITAKTPPPAALDRLGQVPVTRDEALQLSERWQDEKLRNAKINEWLQFARTRCQDASRMVR